MSKVKYVSPTIPERGEAPKAYTANRNPDTSPSNLLKERPPLTAEDLKRAQISFPSFNVKDIKRAMKIPDTRLFTDSFGKDTHIGLGGTLTVNAGVSCVWVFAFQGKVTTDISESSIIVTDADGGDQATGDFEAGTTVSSDGTNCTVTWNSDNALGADWKGRIRIDVTS